MGELRMSQRMLRRTVPWVPIVGLLLVGVVINLVPFLWTLSTSFKIPSQVFAYPPSWIPHPVKWGNYRLAFDQVTGRAFVNSVIFASSIVILQGLATTMGAFAFARLHFPFRNQIFLLYLGTMMIPPQVTLIPTFIIVVRLHWIDTYQGLIIPIVAQGAFGTFMFRQFFLKIPNEIYESARLDGANPFQLFWKLTLP